MHGGFKLPEGLGCMFTQCHLDKEDGNRADFCEIQGSVKSGDDTGINQASEAGVTGAWRQPDTLCQQAIGQPAILL